MKKQMVKTAICEECEEDVPYTVSKIKKNHTIDGVTFEVEQYAAYCNICGHPVNPHEIWSKNFRIIYDEYRKRVGLLTSGDIIRIRKKRGMSQVDLARFIQCGEKNIARYENGAVQDRVFDFLIRLVDDDKVYKEMKRINEQREKALSKLKLSY